MSLEYSKFLFDAQLRNITTVCINSVRKEAWVGCKDGSIRGYDLNKNIFKFRSREHSGLVVRIICWHSQRMMISFGIDGAVVFWSSGALSTDKIYLGEPIFDAVIFAKKQLVIATKSGCKFFPLDAHKLTGHFILVDRMHLICPHRDFVRTLAAQDNRLYSGGMDGTFVVYEHVLHHTSELSPSHVVKKAHAAGIMCIEPCKSHDEEGGCIVATGSYDRHVKIWSSDGQLCHVISGFTASITGLCFIPLTQQLWISSGAPNVTIVDPRTGENISEWIEVFQKMAEDYQRGKKKYLICFLAYSNELEILIAQTDAHYILHWFYNPRGCVLSIPCDQPIESIAVTDQESVSIFTGDSSGYVLKWEKAGFNTIKFSNDQLIMQRKLREAPVKWQTSQETRETQLANTALRDHMTPSTYLQPKYYAGKQTDDHDPTTKINEKSPTQRMLWIETLDLLVVCDERGVMYVWGYEDVETKPEEFAQHFAETAKNDASIIGNIRTVLRPSAAVAAATERLPSKSAIRFSADKTAKGRNLQPRPGSGKLFSLDLVLPAIPDPPELPVVVDTSDSLTSHDMASRLRTAMSDWKIYRHYLNRASGFFCRFILWGHDSCVSGLEYVYDKENDQHVLISTAWDRRLITWNLKTGQIFDVCKRDKTEPKVLEEKETPGEYELVAEGQITDVSYAAKRNEVAYSSRDAHLYVRKFSTHGRKMKLISKWHAHTGEVWQVKWMEQYGAWVSSGQDATIRMWSATEPGTRLALVQCPSSIQVLKTDHDYGWILAAVGNELQIYDPDDLKLIKKHTGHQQIITGIFHVHRLYSEPHYVTSSYDGTIKMWRACTNRPVTIAVDLDEKKIK
ncbi:hypothetical protein BV898_02929 [Hypsibius exemplaris]|uniref:Uncharacterized protein n=1 Tax=Hypsibius exemplaris TaxID=2072580 RepID=A0A1W0X6L7_HYPEX|nr:hypothetical protein BV898_02929 [Hypsibius exemplaris]